MRRIFFLGILLLSGFPAGILGQRSSLPRTAPRPAERGNSIQRRLDRETEVRHREAEIERRLKREDPQVNKNSVPVKPKRDKEQEKRLLPDPEDLNKYAAFLQQPKTGLIRLFPDSDCQSDTSVVRVAEACSSYIPGSSFYSFREKEYTLEGLADIRYKNGFLISDPLVGQGILVTLGDAQLEDVSLEREGMKFINDYEPPAEKNLALKQYEQLSKGVVEGKYLYRNTAPVSENTTYVLRVIAYRGDFFGTMLEGDKRKDIILAFRVVRKEKTGDITLLWKELHRKEAPKFIDPKDEQEKQAKSSR